MAAHSSKDPWRRKWQPTPAKIPGEGNGSPLQYSCLENPMNREAWQATRVGHDLATKAQPPEHC